MKQAWFVERDYWQLEKSIPNQEQSHSIAFWVAGQTKYLLPDSVRRLQVCSFCFKSISWRFIITLHYLLISLVMHKEYLNLITVESNLSKEKGRRPSQPEHWEDRNIKSFSMRFYLSGFYLSKYGIQGNVWYILIGILWLIFLTFCSTERNIIKNNYSAILKGVLLNLFSNNKIFKRWCCQSQLNSFIWSYLQNFLYGIRGHSF